MSYSLGETRHTKAELKTAIRDALAKVPESQPVHEVDIGQVTAAAESFIDLMDEKEGFDLYCSVSGSIYKTDDGVQNVSVSIGLNYQTPRK